MQNISIEQGIPQTSERTVCADALENDALSRYPDRFGISTESSKEVEYRDKRLTGKRAAYR